MSVALLRRASRTLVAPLERVCPTLDSLTVLAVLLMVLATDFRP